MITKIRNLVGAVLVLFAGVAAHAADEFVADELLVGFQPGIRGAQADGIRNGLGATRIKAWPEINAEHWHLPPGLGIAQALQALSANPNVLYAEPNYLIHAVTALPNDPLLGSLWGMHNAGQTGGTPGADMKALEVWQVPPGDGPVVIGVIDTGVDFNHPDLAGRRWVNPGETGLDQRGRDKATNGKDDDRNGYVDDANGWDFINNDNDPMDDHGHGTHVSGTIAGNGNDGNGVIGVAGLNPSVRIMPLKFLGANGSGTDAGAVDAILYASQFLDASGDNVVRLTSNSWGRSGAPSSTMENAILTAGALFVAAAGNDGTSDLHYPAGYSAPNIVSVAASDSNDGLASFSNYGPDWVDLTAPGVSILSCLPDTTYASWNGTSMATPHVSGVAALLMSQNPGLSVDDVKAQILSAVDLVPGLTDKVATSGRLNAARVIGAPALPPASIAPAAVADLAALAISPNSVTLTWTAPGNDGNTGTAYAYDLRYSRSPITTEEEFAAAFQVPDELSPRTAGATETFTVENLTDNTTWYFALKTVDESGNSSELSNPASVALPAADWMFVRLDFGQDMGNYASAGVLSNGYWAVAFDNRAAGLLKCAFLVPPGYGYRLETVMAGGFGPSLAHSPTEEISISHVDAVKRLWFALRSGTNWTTTQLESKDVYTHETSLAYAGADPVITYYKTTRRATGLYVARRTGSTWGIQLVDSGAVAIYNQLAIDAAGNFAVAYSQDSNGDGTVDTLKFARWNGAAWSISNVEAGGFFGTVAFDLVSGNPAVAHWNATSGQLRFLQGNGTGWNIAEIVDTGNPLTGCSLAFAPDGRAFLLYGATTEMRLAIRDPASGLWTVQVMDASTAGSLRNSFKGRPFGTPSGAAYRGPADPGYLPDPVNSSSVRLALRRTPYSD